MCVLTINSYNRQRKRKPSSSCQTFLCNSITHQCLLFFQCKTRAVLWSETLASKPRWWNSRFLFVQRSLNQCGAEAIWGSQGPNQGSRALQGAEGGVGAKKSSDQACNDRQTQKNPCTTHSLRGEHLQKNQQWTSLKGQVIRLHM